MEIELLEKGFSEYKEDGYQQSGFVKAETKLTVPMGRAALSAKNPSSIKMNLFLHFILFCLYLI